MPNILSHLTDPAETQSKAWGNDWARKRFWRACSFILFPFLLMLCFIAALEIAAVGDAADDIVSIYARVNRKRTEATQAFDPELAAQSVLGEVYDAGDKVAFPQEYRMFSRIARTVAYQVESQALSGEAGGGDASKLKRTVRWQLLLSASATWLLQATVVLFFPGMLISLVGLAAWIIRNNPTPQPNQFGSFLDEARYRRSIWLLTETSHLHLWRRLGFALILTLGSSYLFAPTGLKSMAVAQYVALQAIPSENSYPAWLDAFRNAPPAMAGFAGFFLYAMTLTAYRFAIGDLSDRLFVSLFNRSITVMLLSLVLSGISTQGEPISRALAFMVGIFPQSGIQFISKAAGTSFDRFNLDNSTPLFRDLPEIDLWKESVLAEIGVLSPHDLANQELKELVSKVGFNPRILLKAVDRALLLDTLGPGAAKLASVPITTASQLVLYLRGAEVLQGDWVALLPAAARQSVPQLSEQEKATRLDRVKTALGASDPTVVVDALAADSNVLFITEKGLCYDDV